VADTPPASVIDGRQPIRIRDVLRANKPVIAVAFGFSAVMSLLALTTSFYMLQVYDRVLASRSGETLLLLTVIAVAGIAVFATLDTIRAWLLHRLGARVADAIGAPVLRGMVSIASFRGEGAVRQALRDVETVRNFLASPAFAALLDAPFLVIFLLFLFWLHPAFFILVTVGGAILVALALASQIATGKPVAQSMNVLSQAHGFAEDGLRNADVLEGMGMSHAFVARWRRQWLQAANLALNAADKDALLTGLSKTVRLLIQIGLLGIGAVLVLNAESSGGVMIAASIIGARALAPIEGTVGAWRSIIAVRLAVGRLDRLLEQAPRREEGMALPAPTGALLAQHVTFGFPGARKPILSNVSFALAAGESLGVIGPSASGKSTLLRLLSGAWPCAGGLVRLDGADIYTWPRADLSAYIGFLPQDVELFAGTVRENIARLTQGSPEDVVRAAQTAHAHEMILSLPKGYDTDIGQAGHKLSGGQRQRIALARAVFGSPRLVLLDEPNSNLDSVGEEALLATFATLQHAGVTVIVVAHRPTLIAGMDKVLVLADGTVQAFGPRDEVLKRFTARPQAKPAMGNVVPLGGTMAGEPGKETA
jgi:PrtD family type I secretion system ABC transporter